MLGGGGLHHTNSPWVAILGDGAAKRSPEPVGAQEGPKLGWGGATSGSVREPRAEAVPDPLGSAGAGLFASSRPMLL